MVIEQARRESRDAIEAALLAGGANPGRRPNTFHCPFHEDKNPSAWIFEKEGVWKFHCAPCSITEDVYGVEDRFGVPRRVAAPQNGNGHQEPPKPARVDPRAPSGPNKGNGKAKAIFKTVAEAKKAIVHTAAYAYTHPETLAVELLVLRIEEAAGKRFMQLRPCAGGFEFGGLDTNPIYARIRIKDAGAVMVVEGEKCVHALDKLGIKATTSPGGSGAAAKADWSPLAGKQVFVWRDFDEPGEKYAKAVLAKLRELDPAPEIFWMAIETLGLPKGGDVVDFLAAHSGTVEQQHAALAAVLADALPIGDELGPYRERMIAIGSGKWRAVEWPWERLGAATKALYPATQTMICGEGGTSKSLLLRQAVNFWISQGVTVADFELEDDKEFHLNRAHAQLAQESGITNDGWHRANADLYKQLEAEHAPMLKKVARAITDAPGRAVKLLDDMLPWVIRQAKAGKRIIIVDPITACQQGREPWNDDLSFILESRAALSQYGASLIVVTHPKKLPRGATPNLADLAGGQAWPRFTQTVMWIAQMPLEELACSCLRGTTREECNRTVKILKARNSFGTGCEIGFKFDAKTLLFHENGIIQREGKKRGR